MGVHVKVKVDAVIEKPTPPVSRRKVLESTVKQEGLVVCGIIEGFIAC